MQARREERWQAFEQENPELAAEIIALREERRAEQEARRAEFAEKYPNLSAAIEEGRRIPGLGPQANRGFDGERGRRFERSRERDPSQGPRNGPRGGRPQ